MLQEIVKQCGVDKEVIHQRAAKALHHILQNYGHFSITTIDSLTHQIVRTFARDLGLSSTFEVMLETDLLLEQAVDLLIEQTGENKQQTKILTGFVIQKASDNKSWDVPLNAITNPSLFQLDKTLLLVFSASTLSLPNTFPPPLLLSSNACE